MRSVAEYLAKAEEFTAMAAKETNKSLQKRYLDMAKSYALLAQERARLIAEAEIEPESEPPPA